MNNRKRVIYIGLLLIITVIVSITTFSYAFLTRVDEQNGKLNMVVGTLDYKIESDDLNSNNQITLTPNSIKKITIKLTSLNSIDSKYELFYETTNNNVEVGYTGTNAPTGTITASGTKEIEVILSNTTNTNATVTFSCEGGFTYNTLVKSKGISIPSQTSICANYTTHVWNFDYNGTDGSDGSEQIFIAPCAGEYVLETWGGQGGSYDSTTRGGYGAYSVGTINYQKDEVSYINVGGAGLDNTSAITIVNGGYNGGGKTGISGQIWAAGGGGGATHIAKESGLLNTFSEKKNQILMVSGGGGGASYALKSPSYYGTGSGGDAGGIRGNAGGGTTEKYTAGYGATQDNPGHSSCCGTSGFGGYLTSENGCGHGGAGSGLYAGGCGCGPAGGGGSSYIGNSNLTNKAMYCYDCEESTEADTYTISTINSEYMESSSECSNGYSSNPVSKCAKAGNGYARITYKGTTTKKVTYDYNYLPNDIFEENYKTNAFNSCCTSGGTVTANGTTIDSYGKTYYQTGKNGWYFSGVVSNPLPLNNTYTFIFDAKASTNLTARIGTEQASVSTSSIGTNWQRYQYTIKVTSDNSYSAFIFYSWQSPDEDRTLYVRNLQLQEGSLYTRAVNYEANGTLSDIETPKRNGWTFVGWFTDPVGGTQVTSSTSVPNTDTTYYAHWTYNNE